MKAFNGSSYLGCPLFLNVLANYPEGPLDAITIMRVSLLQDRNGPDVLPDRFLLSREGTKQFCPSTGKSVKVTDVKTLVTSVAFTNV